MINEIVESSESTNETNTNQKQPPKQPPSKRQSIADTIIADAISNEDIPIHKKIEILKEKIAAENIKLLKVTQDAAQRRCLNNIKNWNHELNILTSGNEFVDEDGDLDVFDAITYSAIQVANKRSNSLVITGDAGVGKTMTTLVAINFLNPKAIKEEFEEIDIEEGQDEEDEEIKEPTEIKIDEPKAVFTPPAFNKKKKSKVVDSSNFSTNCGYVIQSGTCTTAALYEHLWLHRTKLHVFNDFDSVLKDPESVNLLKAALDTYPVRELSKMTKGNSFNSYGMSDRLMQEVYDDTGKVPNCFKFTGQIIFISNIHEDKFDQPIISRSLHVDVRLTKAETIERMHKLMLDIRPEVSIEYKLEALQHLEYLTTNFTCKFGLNLRELIHAIDYKSEYPDTLIQNKNGKEVHVWKQLLKRRIVKSKLNF